MNASNDEARPDETSARSATVEFQGAGPFTTRHVRHGGGEGPVVVWESRPHRKRLHGLGWEARQVGWHLLRNFWPEAGLNRRIGLTFAFGSLLFIVASVFSLFPGLSSASPREVNAIYFAGSIPFTLAAYLQLFQAANAGSVERARSRYFGWRPSDAGWLSCALQFAGTVLFNVNTFDAMLPSLSWLQQDLLIWIPDIVGSILFFVSGYLAFIEVCHAWWCWKPLSLSWLVVFINLLGCIAFLISAVLAISLPSDDPTRLTWSIVFTLLGAIGFLLGALLMLPEAVHEKETQHHAS